MQNIRIRLLGFIEMITYVVLGMILKCLEKTYQIKHILLLCSS